jgi:hypothetical protein
MFIAVDVKTAHHLKRDTAGVSIRQLEFIYHAPIMYGGTPL